MMVLDAAMEEDQSITREGVVVLIDLREVSMLHALQMTPPLIMKAVHSWQDCYPIRIKRFITLQITFTYRLKQTQTRLVKYMGRFLAYLPIFKCDSFGFFSASTSLIAQCT